MKPKSSYYEQASDRLLFRSLTMEDVELWIPFFNKEDYHRFLGQDISKPGSERAKIWIERQIQRKDEGSYGQVFEECKRRMDHAVQLGASYIIASPPAGPADYDLGAERYRHLLETGCAMGVKPSMEFLGFVDQLNTIEDAMQVMEKSGHPEATTILDPFHIFRGGGSMESIAKLSASQIAVSHFNDAPQDPPREVQHDHNRVMPGEGHLDLRRYVDLLSGTGYNGYLSLELFREELWTQDPFEVARWGLEKMRATVEG